MPPRPKTGPRASKRQKGRAAPSSRRKSNTPSMPMAYTPRGRTRASDPNRIVVSGRDLVIPTPATLPTGVGKSPVFQVIPANPIYWSGTRISKQAGMYQVFRPLRFHVHYKPQVAVTNPGLVVFGTLFADATVTEDELQQVLNTSNGGGISQCYVPFTSKVDLRALQLKQFNTVGNPASTDNMPFVWVATYSGYAPGAVSASTMPGWVEVDWEFEFMSGNPGSGNSGVGSYTFSTAEAVRYSSMRTARGLRAFDWNAPFGIPLGAIKEMATPLLRHVGVCLLNGASSTSFRYGVGKILTWIGDNLSRTRATDNTLLRDDDGSEVSLPDDTPVILMMSGLPQPAEAALTFGLLRVRAKGYDDENNAYDYLWEVAQPGFYERTTTNDWAPLTVSLVSDDMVRATVSELPGGEAGTLTYISIGSLDTGKLAYNTGEPSVYWVYKTSKFTWTGAMPDDPEPAPANAPVELVDEAPEEEEPPQPLQLTEDQAAAVRRLLAEGRL